MAAAPIPLLGEWASLLAAMIWACSITLYSRFGQHVRSSTLNLYKNLVAITCLAVAGSLVGWNWPADRHLILAFAASGLIGLALGDTLMFHGMRHLGPQKTSVIQCLAPPLAALLAWAFFGETLSLWEWLGLAITAIALALVMGDHARGPMLTSEGAWKGLAAAMGAAVCQALTVLILRFSLQETDVFTGTMLRIVPAIGGLTLLSLAQGHVQDLKNIYKTPRHGLILTGAAFMGTFIGLLLLSTGAKYAKAGVTTAISSTYPIWIIPITCFVLKEKVAMRQIVLTVLAVVGVAVMMIGPI
jgi:drug/metabolite transporter (DMT)-like permease